MRVILRVRGKGGTDRPDKHDIQAVLYNAFGDSEFGRAHDDDRFKYFTYSDYFCDTRGRGTVIVSSPHARLVDTVFDWFSGQTRIRLGKEYYEIEEIQKVRPRLSNTFISGSPIVLYRDSTSGEYFSLDRHGDISFFLERLKDNAIKKYEFYSGKRISFDEPIFDEVEFRKEVAVPVRIRGSQVIFIGSVWKMLRREDMSGLEGFYSFLMETGLGEKNSLGFGFVNPVECSNR
ncbi:MAG: CRISPR-associated endoribonuclease Cas6 [Candidatus Thorarchaeota archaeon]